MKLLTFTIPCYNSQDYMRHCIESILPGGEDVEILIVDDGSKDDTAAIADEYAEKYPTIVKAIHQENGGHGEAVNAGIRNATGLYFKVVDSDDWVDWNAYQAILAKLREIAGGSVALDMLLANYVYEKEGAKHKRVMRQTGFPKDQIFTWSDVRHFYKGHYILMHSVIYRTKLLRECGLELPKHTFYVDNIYVYKPLPHVRTMYYMDVDFYRYFIGREDQSVNEKVMISRIDQQIRVNKIMIDDVDLNKVSNYKCRHYMINYLEIITVVTTVMLLRSGTEENLEKKRELWRYIKNKDIGLFHRLRNGIMGQTMNLPGRSGRKISVVADRKRTGKLIGFLGSAVKFIDQSGDHRRPEFTIHNVIFFLPCIVPNNRSRCRLFMDPVAHQRLPAIDKLPLLSGNIFPRLPVFTASEPILKDRFLQIVHAKGHRRTTDRITQR